MINKNKINSKLKLISIFILFTLTLLSVNSATALNVVLANQEPDPVSPGNFVFINVKISNSGSDNIKTASIQMIQDDNFKIAQGSELNRELGVIPSFSSGESSSSFVIAKYKIEVDSKTPLGLNTIGFEVKADSKVFDYEFDILVEDKNPNIQINKFSVNQLEPGKTEKLTLELENINSIDLRDVIVSLDLAEVEDEILSVSSGTNQITINNIKANEKRTIEFDLVSSPEAKSKPYILPVKISFQDTLGNNYDSEVLGSIRIFSNPQVSLTLDSQDIYTEGKGKVTLAIANFGTSSVKGTQIKLLESDEYEIISGNSQYVGDLNPDDFQTIQSEIYLRNSDATTLKVRLSYLDSYNVKSEVDLDIPLKIYGEADLEKFGIKTSNNSSSGTSIFVTIVLLVIIFFVGRYFGSRRNKKNR